MTGKDNGEKIPRWNKIKGSSLDLTQVIVCLTCLYAGLCFSPTMDISLLAMPLSLAAGAVTWFLARKENSERSLRRMFRYLPLILLASLDLRFAKAIGTGFSVYRFITAVLWCIIFTMSYTSCDKLSAIIKAQYGKASKKDVRDTIIDISIITVYAMFSILISIVPHIVQG